MIQISFKPPPLYDGKNRQPYDTKEGVRGYLGSINTFLQLCALRQQAVKVRGEVLNTLYVFGGRFVLDQFGQVLNSYNPSTKVPDVLTIDEYKTYLEGQEWCKNVGGISYAYETVLPNEHVVCPHCKSGWTIDTMHDLFANDVQIDDIPLKGFVGKTIRDVFTAFSVFTDAMYIQKFVEFLYNDKYVDMSPAFPDEPESNYPKNQGGLFKPEGDLYDYVVTEGDRACFTKREVFHVKCMREHVTLKCWYNVAKSLQEAGITGYKVEQITNEYDSSYPFYPSWFIVKNDSISLKIGERKKVVHVEVLTETGLNLEELFEKEDVTKSKNCIHAWGYDKVTEYLKTIQQNLAQQPVT